MRKRCDQCKQVEHEGRACVLSPLSKKAKSKGSKRVSTCTPEDEPPIKETCFGNVGGAIGPSVETVVEAGAVNASTGQFRLC